jgi:hypothetical protein
MIYFYLLCNKRVSMFTFLSDIQGDSKAPFRAPPSSGTSAYWEQAGRPQYENPAGAMYPPLTNTPQQLQGSSMFTSLEGVGGQQPAASYGPPQQPQQLKQQQQQQQQPVNPVAENQYLKQHLMGMQNYIQQMKQQQQMLLQQRATDTPKKSCNIMVVTLMIIFLIVTVILFVFCRRLSAVVPPAVTS